MKIRNGFVSNSSSSSFIVSAEKGQIPTVVVEIKLPIDKTVETVKQLDKYFIERWGYGQKTIQELLTSVGKYATNLYNECLEELKKGNIIHMGNVSNESENPEDVMLYYQGLCGGKLKNGKVIQDCQE